jgi:hypothetical protein
VTVNVLDNRIDVLAVIDKIIDDFLDQGYGKGLQVFYPIFLLLDELGICRGLYDLTIPKSIQQRVKQHIGLLVVAKFGHAFMPYVARAFLRRRILFSYHHAVFIPCEKAFVIHAADLFDRIYARTPVMACPIDLELAVILEYQHAIFATIHNVNITCGCGCTVAFDGTFACHRVNGEASSNNDD